MVSGVNGAIDPLAQLRDIHLPAPIGWWPLSSGWFILLVVLFVSLGLSAFCIRRRFLWRQPQKEGLRLLMVYEKEYKQGGNPRVLGARISELLRRVALAYFPREEIAGLQGDLWIDFLNKTGTGINFNEVRDCLVLLPYQNQGSLELDALFFCAKSWIKGIVKHRRGDV